MVPPAKVATVVPSYARLVTLVPLTVSALAVMVTGALAALSTGKL